MITFILLIISIFITFPLWIWFAPIIMIISIIYYLFFIPLPNKQIVKRSIILNDGITHKSNTTNNLLDHLEPDIHTIDQLFYHSVQKYGSRDCMGIRKEYGYVENKKIIKVNGKAIEKIWKVVKKDKHYEWLTYDQVNEEVSKFGCGLIKIGLKPFDKISLYMDTCSTWQKVAQSCFRYNFPIVTSYASLGEDALAFSFNQTKSSVVITSSRLLPTVFKSCSQSTNIKYVIYGDSENANTDDLDEVLNFNKNNPNISVLTIADVMLYGNEKNAPKVPPKPNDLAVIMYTSGSTGNPKGVMISHNNIVAVSAGVIKAVPLLKKEDTFISYLPLAHILALVTEIGLLSFGGRIGYSNPQHLTNDGVVDLDGKPCGDFAALKPTLCAAVPLIMDRMRSAVLDKIESSFIMKKVFHVAYAIKKRRYLAGLNSPVLDLLIFKKVQDVLGGNIRMMISGGAPLNSETQLFMNIVFCIPVCQGLGATETTGIATLSHYDDVTTDHVGYPFPTTLIKLADVPEMGYTNKDLTEDGKPMPRGEIYIGGANVTLGYFEMPEKTAEDFYVDENNVRWFKSGDIGRWNSDGSLSIIDRKKDLIKLAGGEYVALGNVEAKLKSCSLVENVCVYCNSHEPYPVAVIIPNKAKLIELSKTLGLDAVDFHKLVDEPILVENVLMQLKEVSKSSRLKPFETICNVKILYDEWTSACGLLTDALKIKRPEINKTYEKVFLSLYGRD